MTENAEIIIPDAESHAEAEAAEAEAVEVISEDIPSVSDGGAETPRSDAEADGEADILRGEIARLKELIEKKEADEQRSLRELEEFSRLYPDAELDSVPAEVWEKVDGGIPLSAAYALYEREKYLLEARANEVNLRNASLSAGKADAFTKSEYFSPDEVRVMSQKEVHENYKNIKRSMTYWRKAAK